MSGQRDGSCFRRKRNGNDDLRKPYAFYRKNKCGVQPQYILRRLNREIGSNFEVNSFYHYAFYNPCADRVEMHLVSKERKQVSIPKGGIIHFDEGETIRGRLIAGNGCIRKRRTKQRSGHVVSIGTMRIFFFVFGRERLQFLIGGHF